MTEESPRGGLKTVTTGVMRLNPADLENAILRATQWGMEADIRYTIIEEKTEIIA